MFKNFFPAATLCLMPALAQATVYDCKVNSGSLNGGWLTEQYFFEFIPGQAGVEVLDPLIFSFNNEQPVAGTVTSQNDAKVSFRWAVLVQDKSGQRTKMDFRAVLYYANNEFSVQGNPVGYADKFHARGLCSVAE